MSSGSKEKQHHYSIAWKNLSERYKDAFAHRMNLLNERPKVGMIMNPFIVLNIRTEEQNENNTLCILGKTIHVEVEQTRKAIHGLLVKGCRNNKESNKLYTFGKEKIHVGSHLFKILAVPLIVIC